MLGAEMTRRLHISRPAVLKAEKVDWAANADAADKQSDIPEQSANDNRLFGGRH
ncbi:hypothetical protein T4C_8333 [Trichinella pseudospiralis]|uniref:Uncharacterized protein n=1 Tax=Trichinella pseudospiralis TaxID=6337 RepID=A0A0V1JYT5_TRIPS|nr:hypothetical protein T4C_8333 [Trichinella pseudospiralis]